MKLKFRCPSCAKLYEVQSEEISSETPQFQCLSCESRFAFSYPPEEPTSISCYLIPTETRASAPANEVEEASHSAMKACPKCGALNGRRSQECYSCHVLFWRLEGLPVDTSLKAQPSLVRKWKKLVDDFENELLHDEFIISCHQFDALRFALLKYEELKTAQGGDAKCVQMIARINTLLSVKLAQSEARGPRESKERPKWRKFLFLAPFALSSFLILAGILNLAHRNLVGVGVALAFMVAGLIIMVQGHLSLSDFID
jgi:ribosomal protein L40E/DNA-directed RNA polymerase subunit RPC12/RpoP